MPTRVLVSGAAGFIGSSAVDALSTMRAQVVSAARPAADASYTGASIDKARGLLGYQPRTDHREGLRRMWAWYSELRP